MLISKWQSPLVQIAVAQKPGIQKYWLVYPFHFGKKKTKKEQVPMNFFEGGKQQIVSSVHLNTRIDFPKAKFRPQS